MSTYKSINKNCSYRLLLDGGHGRGSGQAHSQRVAQGLEARRRGAASPYVEASASPPPPDGWRWGPLGRSTARWRPRCRPPARDCSGGWSRHERRGRRGARPRRMGCLGLHVRGRGRLPQPVEEAPDAPQCPGGQEGGHDRKGDWQSQHPQGHPPNPTLKEKKEKRYGVERKLNTQEIASH